MTINLIQTKEECKRAIVSLKDVDVIGLDFEFFRQDTYFAKLCLIQISIKQKVYIFDVLSDKSISQEVLNFLCESTAIKVIHASNQDLEIIYILTKKALKNVFDSQIAANFCGFEFQISYAKLVYDAFSVDLNKKLQASNWQKRPLTKNQINYLVYDVVYLDRLYHKLHKELIKNNNIEWFEAEMKQKLLIDRFVENTDFAWKKVRSAYKKTTNFNILTKLASFRQIKAVKLNKPVRWILSDRALVALATVNNYKNEFTAFKKFSDLRKNKIYNNEVKKNNNLDKEVWEVISQVESFTPMPNEGTRNRSFDEVVTFCKLVLLNLARSRNICHQVIANESDIIKFIDNYKQSNLMQSWRKDFFGTELKQTLLGQKFLSIKNLKVVFKSNEKST